VDFSELMQGLNPDAFTDASIFLLLIGLAVLLGVYVMGAVTRPAPAPCKPHAWGLDRHGLICSKCGGRPQEQTRHSHDFED